MKRFHGALGVSDEEASRRAWGERDAPGARYGRPAGGRDPADPDKSNGSGVIVDLLVRERLLFFARPSLLVC
jgi:hypothetical protein